MKHLSTPSKLVVRDHSQTLGGGLMQTDYFAEFEDDYDGQS